MTTLRASADVDVIQINGGASKLRGIRISDMLIQGYGKFTSTKCGINFITETDIALIENVNITECNCGFYAYKPDAINIICSSFQWNALGILIQSGMYVNINNICVADNHGVSTVTVNGTTYTVNTGGIAIQSYNSCINASTFARNDSDIVSSINNCFNAISVLNGYCTKISNCVINTQNGNGIGIIGNSESSFAEIVMITGCVITNYGMGNITNNKNGIYIRMGHINIIQDNFIGSSLGRIS